MLGRAAILALWAAPVLAGAAQITFQSLDGTTVPARVLMPAGAPKGAVVALHGCGGLYAANGPRKGQLSARHEAMAKLLVHEGYAVVFPDSLTPRGETELCTQAAGQRKLGQKERRADALGAIAWVSQQPWGSADRIALLGWSHGGSAVLSATDANRRDVAAQKVKPAVAIAFYPGCSATQQSAYRPNTRLVMLLAEKDDWTPAAPCIELGLAAAAEVIVYPDSYHDFDNPVGAVKVRRDVPNGVRPGLGVHAGANPAARQQANDRVREVLKEAFR